MNMEKLRNLSKAKPKPKNEKWRALEYFILGLTASEIETLTGINKRTLERYMMAEKWKEQRQSAKEKEHQKIINQYLEAIREKEPKPEKPKTQNERIEKQKNKSENAK